MSKYKGTDKSLARPGRKQANVSVRREWISFGAFLCRGGGGGRELMTTRVTMLLKSRASLKCSRACFRPVRATDLSAPGNFHYKHFHPKRNTNSESLLATTSHPLTWFGQKRICSCVLWSVHFSSIRSTMY